MVLDIHGWSRSVVSCASIAVRRAQEPITNKIRIGRALENCSCGSLNKMSRGLITEVPVDLHLGFRLPVCGWNLNTRSAHKTTYVWLIAWWWCGGLENGTAGCCRPLKWLWSVESWLEWQWKDEGKCKWQAQVLEWLAELDEACWYPSSKPKMISVLSPYIANSRGVVDKEIRYSTWEYNRQEMWNLLCLLETWMKN